MKPSFFNPAPFDPALGKEQPYSDSGCVKKGWIGNYYFDNEEWYLEFDVSFASHSKNWCMGSLNIDLFHFSFAFGPFSLFFAYRIEIFPPQFGVLKNE